MGARWAASGLALGIVLALGAPAGPASADVERQVILIVSPGMSYEGALDDPLLGDLAGDGGIGLLTTSGDTPHRAQATVSLGAGRSAAGAPRGPVLFTETASGLLVDAAPYRESAGEAEVGLLGSVLAEAGLPVGYVDLESAEGDPAMLAAMDVGGHIPLAFLNTFPVLGDLPPEFLGSAAEDLLGDASLVVSPDAGLVPFAIEHTTASEILVLVIPTPPTEAMLSRGDMVTPVIAARGAPEHLLMGKVSAGGLTSRTTRRAGIVSSVDVAPTVLEFLGIPGPEEMVGSSIEFAGQAPTDLHRRYLEWRGVVSPIGQVALGLAILSLVAGFVLAMGRWRPPRWAFAALAVTGLGSLALLVTFVPASLLPSFSWPVVIGALAAGAIAISAAALRLGRDRVDKPVAIVALVGLVLVVIDVAAGWRSGLTPLLGGSALDGERFFGLGNPYAGIVLSGGVLGAALLRPRNGVALLVAAAGFAGLPFLGADVGGCITLAVAAALWFAFERWDRLDRRGLALAAAAALAAVAVVIVTHRLLPPGETHVSRAVGQGGVLGAVEIFWDRLALNLRITSEVPSAWLAVLGLPVWLLVAQRPPKRLRPVFATHEPWRRAVIVLALSGMVGYVVNDTFGTASIAFLFLSAAIVYPAVAARWKETPVREPAPSRADG
jgi:hypothetical protein